MYILSKWRKEESMNIFFHSQLSAVGILDVAHRFNRYKITQRLSFSQILLSFKQLLSDLQVTVCVANRILY